MNGEQRQQNRRSEKRLGDSSRHAQRAERITGAGGGGGVVATAPRGGVLWSKNLWRRGHPILGFFSGLLFGLGATVLLWQYNVWLLNIVTAIVVPLAPVRGAGAVFPPESFSHVPCTESNAHASL